MKPAGGIGGGAPAAPASGSGGGCGLGRERPAVGQVTRVTCRVQACPAHQHAGPAVAHLELEQLLHLVLGHAVCAKNRWRRAHIRVADEAGGTAEVGAQALDVELGEDAPRGGYVEAVRVGRRALMDTEGAHPTRGKQRAGGKGRVFRAQQHLSPEVASIKVVESSRCCACVSLPSARARLDMNFFLLSCSWHERTIYRASGVKLFLCGHGKGHRNLSAEHFMRISVGYGGPARGQAQKL